MCRFTLYLLIGESVQVLVIWAEEQIFQDGAAVTHDDVFVQQSRLGNGVDEDLREVKQKKK